MDVAEPIVRIVDRLPAADAGAELDDVIRGLLDRPARISPKYFYDPVGCALYGAICQLPEYYPTRTEQALFERERRPIAEAVGPVRQLVDLGAGDCVKARGWLPWLAPARYVAVDIAGEEIRRALARLATDFPAIEMSGVVTDFSRELLLGEEVGDGPTLFFYPGSSIGNFAPPDAVRFLASVRRACAERPGSRLLIGVDAKKDPALLDAAYDDALGVTAAFNRNSLRHLNTKFGFDFPIEAFGHVGFYHQAEGRVEMHLEALREVDVRLGARVRRFAKGERIHTENSYKYGPGEFDALLREAGFTALREWRAPGDAYFTYLAS